MNEKLAQQSNQIVSEMVRKSSESEHQTNVCHPSHLPFTFEYIRKTPNKSMHHSGAFASFNIEHNWTCVASIKVINNCMHNKNHHIVSTMPGSQWVCTSPAFKRFTEAKQLMERRNYGNSEYRVDRLKTVMRKWKESDQIGLAHCIMMRLRIYEISRCVYSVHWTYRTENDGQNGQVKCHQCYPFYAFIYAHAHILQCKQICCARIDLYLLCICINGMAQPLAAVWFYCGEKSLQILYTAR